MNVISPEFYKSPILIQAASLRWYPSSIHYGLLN